MTDRAASAEETRSGDGRSATGGSVVGTPDRSGVHALCWIVGLAPVVLRARAQGLLVVALVVVLAAGLLWWLSPARWKAHAAVATAVGVGVVLLPVSLGLASGAFAAAGVVVTDTLPNARLTRECRAVAAGGLLIGSMLLLGGHLVALPAAVVLAGVAVAAIVQRVQPTRLRRSLDAAAANVDRLRNRAERSTFIRSIRCPAWWTPSPPPPSGWVLAICAVIGGLGVLLSLRDQRLVLIDDAAITFRYAVRIATGDGFTYNDGDQTNGASAPLYTLILSLGQLVGLPVEAFARAIGVAAYSASAALVSAILSRARGLLAGAVGGGVLLTSASFRTEALTGMESGLAAMLGLLVIFLLMEGRVSWAGVVLGLAVANKVDASFLAVAVGTASWLVLRRPPWRLAAVAAATAAPWFLFSQLYFGSPLPFSASQKLGGEVASATNNHDPLWIYRRIEQDGMEALLLAGLLLGALIAARLVQLERRPSLATLSCSLWVALHGAAFSLLDLGDPYPWYTTVLFPPLVCSGVLAVFLLAERLVESIDDATASRPRAARTRWVLLLALLAVVAISVETGARVATRVALAGHDTTDFERFEDDRRRGGQYVGDNAERGEVVESCYGWVAFGTLDNPFRETCPLSTRIDPGPPTWVVESYLDGQTRSDPAPDRKLVKTFRSPLGVTLVYRAAG